MTGTLTNLGGSKGNVELSYCLSDPGNSYPMASQISHVLPEEKLRVDEFLDIWAKTPKLDHLDKVGTVGPISGSAENVDSINFRNEKHLLERMKKII